MDKFYVFLSMQNWLSSFRFAIFYFRAFSFTWTRLNCYFLKRLCLKPVILYYYICINSEHIRASSYTVKSLCDSIDDEIYLRPRDDTNRATLQIQIDSNELRNHTSSCACLFHVVEDTGFIGKLRTDLTIHDDMGNKFLSTDIGFEFCSDCCRVRRPYSYESVWFQNNIQKDVRQFAVEIRQGLPMVSDTLKLHGTCMILHCNIIYSLTEWIYL